MINVIGALIIVAIITLLIWNGIVMYKDSKKRYSFYLHDCTGLYEQTIIMAHHFERKDNGGLVFYDGNEDIVFDTDIIWTNVYRGNQR